MAQIKSITFGEQALLIGDGGSPELFVAPCGINSLTKSTSTNTSDVDLPDCDDPDAVVWLGVDEVSKRMTLTFSGTLAQQYLASWQEWELDGGLRNVRWLRNLTNLDLRGYLEGPALLTEFEESAESRGRYTFTGTIIFDGKPVWVSLPAAPTNTVAPTFTGTLADTETQTAVDGTWTGTPNYTYQWERSANGANGWASIAGATSNTYTADTADVGNYLRVKVTGTNGGGSTVVYSASRGPVTA
jgi:hypothetical protein